MTADGETRYVVEAVNLATMAERCTRLLQDAALGDQLEKSGWLRAEIPFDKDNDNAVARHEHLLHSL